MATLIIIGPPGSGKGTQAELICKKYGLTLFEAGREIRKIEKTKSQAAKKITKHTSQGKMVPDNIVLELLEIFLKQNTNKKIMLDGIPRTESQILPVEGLLNKYGFAKPLVINLIISNEKLVDRLLKRERQDDRPDIIAKRIDNFATQTGPVIEHYRVSGRLLDINGEQTIELVNQEIISKLNTLGYGNTD